MKRSRKTDRPRASTALPSRSNSMMSSAVTSAGASERDIRKRSGLVGWRALTWPNPSSTPKSARMRLPITMSSRRAASTPAIGADWTWADVSRCPASSATIAVAASRARPLMAFLDARIINFTVILPSLYQSYRRQHRKLFTRMPQAQHIGAYVLLREAIDPRRCRSTLAGDDHVGHDVFRSRKHCFDAAISSVAYPPFQATQHRLVLDPGAVAHALHPADDRDPKDRAAHLFFESQKLVRARLHFGFSREPTHQFGGGKAFQGFWRRSPAQRLERLVDGIRRRGEGSM